MPSRDLDPVTRLTADAVGEPGQRTFYLQAASGADQVTLLVEKEQVRRLAESLQTWLPELAADRPEDPVEAAAAEAGELALTPPLEPDFRVGQLTLSYDTERDRVVVSPASVTAIAFGPAPYLARLNDTGGNADLAPPKRPRRRRARGEAARAQP